MHAIEAENATSLQIYTGSADKTLRIWLMETGQVSIPPHSSSTAPVFGFLLVDYNVTCSRSPICFVCFDLQCIQTIDAGGEVDSMLLSGKMLIVGLHVSAEEGMVRAWHIDTGSDVVLPGRHRVRPCSLQQPPQALLHPTPACSGCMCSNYRQYMTEHGTLYVSF